MVDEHRSNNPSSRPSSGKAHPVTGTTDKVVEGPIPSVDSTHPPEGHRNLVPVATVPVDASSANEVHSPIPRGDSTGEGSEQSPNMLDKTKNKSKSFISKMLNFFKGGSSGEEGATEGEGSGGKDSGTESKTIAINTDNSKVTSTVTETPTTITCTVTEHVSK